NRTRNRLLMLASSPLFRDPRMYMPNQRQRKDKSSSDMMARMAASLFDLTGKTAVVVGGTSGIGRVLALGLADAGADVVATARRAQLVDEVAREIEATGRRTLRVETDVLDRASLTEASDAIQKAFGHIDVVVY